LLQPDTAVHVGCCTHTLRYVSYGNLL